MASLQDEMTKIEDAPRMSARPTAATTKKVELGKLEHSHDLEPRAENWTDEDGRRRTRQIAGRRPTYQWNCRACNAEDIARRESPPTLTDDELKNTLFLIPEHTHDSALARLYLEKRYAKPELAALCDLRPQRLATWQGAQIVVIARRPAPGKGRIGDAFRRSEDKHGNTVDIQIPVEEFLPEIYESKPIVIADCVVASKATMFSESISDVSELQSRLSEFALPRYYIASYQRVVGSDERWFTLRSL